VKGNPIDHATRRRKEADPAADARPAPLIGDRLVARVAGAAPVAGNAVRLLRDAAENYPAWLDAIAAARRSVRFENYIFRADAAGRPFADALIAKAREGVAVHLLYDWFGTFGSASSAFWQRLRAAGVQVRCFNPPRFSSPFGWLGRNHRKSLTVDGEIGFVSGLCVGAAWLGNSEAGVAPWRDTGVELRGPAVADLEAAFADTWALSGPPMDTGDAPPPRDLAIDGGVPVSVIASQPNTMGLYRLDQLVATGARRTLWLTDAYFVGTTAYVRTLIDAAQDGVDVRLLVPGASDLAVPKALSRAGYRPLLEAGIRVFEWNGPMLHAKTAVADGSWARIGSSNLNLASWVGNWELDISVEDADFAGQMEAMFRADLANATEIVLDLGHVHAAPSSPEPPPMRRGSPGRVAAGALGIGSTVGAAITNRRALGPAEARVMAAAGVVLLIVAAVAMLLPRLVTVPLALITFWIATTLLVRAWQLRIKGR
jgi:cardiolipin synthase A/B